VIPICPVDHILSLSFSPVFLTNKLSSRLLTNAQNLNLINGKSGSPVEAKAKKQMMKLKEFQLNKVSR